MRVAVELGPLAVVGRKRRSDRNPLRSKCVQRFGGYDLPRPLEDISSTIAGAHDPQAMGGVLVERKEAWPEARSPSARFDVVIDMICFRAEEAESDVRAFGGRCEQLQFCSSVAAYGVKI